MNIYVQLSLVAVLPVAASCVFVFLQHHTAFGTRKRLIQQLIIGLVFGLLSICGTEFGVLFNGANINVRDAAPLCAGLIFGAPAGMLAALIGALERFIGVAWGLGAYTQLACTLATVFAGLIGALFHRFILEGKRASWMHGFAVAVVTEVFHMLMVFFTHMEDAESAFMVVKACAGPMIIVNAISVMLACLIARSMDKRKIELPLYAKTISSTLQKYLLFFVTLAFILIVQFSSSILQYLAENSLKNVISMTLWDVRDDIESASEKRMLAIAQNSASIISAFPPSQYKTATEKLIRTFGMAEVNIVDDQGIIVASSNPDYVGYDMSLGEQSREFLVLLEDDGVEEYAQGYRTNYYGVSRKYAAHTMTNGGFVQIGYNLADMHEDIKLQVKGISQNRHIMMSGFVLITEGNLHILSDTSGYLAEADPDSVNDMLKTIVSVDEYTLTKSNALGYPTYAMYIETEGFYLIGIVPQEEAMLSRDISRYANAFVLILVFTAFFILLFLVVRRHIVKNVNRINASLSEITKGNLDTTVNVRGNAEFSSMSDYINETVDTLKGYIAEAASRLDKDLALAKQIQASALPGIFPPYPNRTEFDIFASMTPAKEVGGDFYDFYLLGENRLAFLVADVSGKGIPGAMFMMTAKTVLSNFAESGLPVEEVLTRANNKLCENNEAEMFVTCWMGILDLSTGKVEFANAGHNPPLLKHAGGWEYLRTRAGFVLAGMEDMIYRKTELVLQPGDTLFLYTDGVTEATNINEELYGEERLQAFLNRSDPKHAKELCELVKADLDAFVGEADQFDDITMLALKYLGQKN